MRSRLMVALTLVVLVVAALGLAGCVDSSEEAAQTPSGAATVANSAAQTDSEGKTITAPAQTAPAAGGGGTETGGGGAAPAGDVAAGLVVFEASCTGCHLADGMEAGGVGPKLAGLGLTEQRIHDQVVNGGAVMPAGLVSGADLDNVVAYTLSIQ